VADHLVSVTEYSDPICPYAFSAAPALLALRWFYGEQLEWRLRLVVLSESPEEILAKGITPQVAAANAAALAERFGMPLAETVPSRLIAALPADLAIKALQLHAPALAGSFFRALQVAWHSGRRMIDEPETIAEIARGCAIDPIELESWVADPATREQLDDDRLAARSPLAAAAGPLDHKLGGPTDQRRYTCPTLAASSSADAGHILVAPGMQELGAYEVMLANTEPRLVRRAPADDPLTVLGWADWPLAAAEVAAVMEIGREEAEQHLAAAGAIEGGGYWSLPSGDQPELAAGGARADRLVGGAGLGQIETPAVD
jgi:predicted DsbA family dithiol-disulfide isomerase